jgi:hypothetical protein
MCLRLVFPDEERNPIRRSGNRRIGCRRVFPRSGPWRLVEPFSMVLFGELFADGLLRALILIQVYISAGFAY